MSTLPVAQQLIAAFVLSLLGLAALIDVRSLRIPNQICLFLVCLYPVYVVSMPTSVNWPGAILVAIAVFAVGCVGFATRTFGGGDVKLLTVVSLWAGPSLVIGFLSVTLICGGALAIAMLSRFRVYVAWALDAAGEVEVRDVVLGRHVPYGVAIAIGGFWVVSELLSVHS